MYSTGELYFTGYCYYDSAKDLLIPIGDSKPNYSQVADMPTIEIPERDLSRRFTLYYKSGAKLFWGFLLDGLANDDFKRSELFYDWKDPDKKKCSLMLKNNWKNGFAQGTRCVI